MSGKKHSQNNDLPGKVSWRVVDAWVAIPPCNGKKPFCHVQCPYFYECYPPEENYEEDYNLNESQQ